MTTLFVSDLHLCAERPATNRLFLDFLAGPACGAKALYVLGDLFEYWIGDDDLGDPFNSEVCRALHDLTASGVPVFFMAGNRDFLVGDAFAAAAGLTLLPDPCVVPVEGLPTLLMHGDTLCTADPAYDAFRAKVRSSAWQREFLSLPLAERKRQVEGLRRDSEAQKRLKPAEIMDVDPVAVAAALREHGCARLIHGHTHRPAHQRFAVDGRPCERWVLADWYGPGSYLECGAAGCRAVALGSGESGSAL